MNHRTYFEDIGAWPAHAAVGKKPRAVWPMYALGFVLSLLLTLQAYAAVVYHAFPLPMAGLIAVLIGLAAVQFIVQLVFFFHLEVAKAAYERLAVLGGTLMIVGILVSGSVWIMFTLDARMMPDAAHMMDYMNSQPGL